METKLSALEKRRKAAEKEASAKVEASVRHFKETCLKAHLAAPYRGGGGTGEGMLDPATLTDEEVKAILAGLGGKKAEVKDGVQDSVDVCVEYLKDNKAAAADFKSRVKE